MIKTPEADFKYIQLEQDNAKLQRDVKQLTDDNKLMWDLWKQVQASKPDVTQIIAITAEREAKKFSAKEKHIWALIEEKDCSLQRLQDLLEAKDREMRTISAQLSEVKGSEATLKVRNSEFALVEEKLKDEIERLNKQLIDSDDVNNRLLVSMEKDNTALKNEVECLRRELCDKENAVLSFKSNFEAANNSSTTLWAELSSYQQMVAILEAEAVTLKTTCAELRKSLDDKHAELECALMNNDKIADEINNQCHLIRNLEFQLDKLSARNKELEADAALLRQRVALQDDHNSTQSHTPLLGVENLMSEISDLKEQLSKVTKAYEAKSFENEMLRTSQDERLNIVERLQSEQRALHDGLDGLDQRLRKETKREGDAINQIQQLEASLESERLIALLKQHCRELANDRDVYAGRLEKSMIQLANRESSIADLKLRLANFKRDREAEIRKLNAECNRRVEESSKQNAGKLSAELSRQKSEVAALEKRLEMFQSEKRRLRAALTACQARLARESALVTRQNDRIIELEHNAMVKDTKQISSRNISAAAAAAESQRSRRRRARSASYCATEEPPSPPEKKHLLTFDMATQTEETGLLAMLTQRQPSPATSNSSTAKSSRRSAGTRQQLNVERMRVSRLLRLAADLKTDRMKIKTVLDEERQARLKFETALSGVKAQLSSALSSNNQLETKLATAEADVARLRKSVLDCEQKMAEQPIISPRADKSVITDQMDSCTPAFSTNLTIEHYEELKQRLATMLVTEREQGGRLRGFQMECERLSADLSLAKERLNDARRELAKERRTSEDQREKLRAFEQQVSSDSAKIKELTERLCFSERSDKTAATRLMGLKRRLDECESEKCVLQKRFDEKQDECERLTGSLKKTKTRCQYVEVLLTAEKANYSRLEAAGKEDAKKFQFQISIQNTQLSEFRRFLELLCEMLGDRIRYDRRTVQGCEISVSHNRQTQRQTPQKRALSQSSEAASLTSRAASIAQQHLKLSAAEAAELLMIGSVDASPRSSAVGFDTPEAFMRKITNIMRQIFSSDNDSDDATQFANRLCDAFFNGFMDHLRFLLTRPQCCISAVITGDEKSPLGDYQRHTQRSNSSTVNFSDSVFSGSPY